MIELEHVTKTYRTGSTEVRALDDVSLTIAEGETVIIVGEQASGKSSLMKILSCQDVPADGSYRLDGVDMADERNQRSYSHRISSVVQSFQLIPRMSALRNVELALGYELTAERRASALRALARVGLADRAAKTPNELTGEEQQRVAIARALVSDPVLLLADDPAGNLDVATKSAIVDLLVSLAGDRGTTVVITSERGIDGFGGRVVRLCGGRVVADTCRQRVLEALTGVDVVALTVEATVAA